MKKAVLFVFVCLIATLTGCIEIIDDLGDAPDIHALPVGNAGNITAYWKCYKEYNKDGLTTKLPMMYGFQAAGAAPIVKGKVVKNPETIATAIRIGNPASWQQAVEAAGGKVPSGRIVKDIVQRILERTKIPIPYRVGDVCEILIKDNPDLRGLGGCWCIVIEVREFSCLVRTWNGEYTVREENLRDLQYSPDHRQKMKGLSHRLVELRSLGEEETVRAILETLGSLKRPYLNPWEEKLLEFLEGYIRF